MENFAATWQHPFPIHLISNNVFMFYLLKSRYAHDVGLCHVWPLTLANGRQPESSDLQWTTTFHMLTKGGNMSGFQTHDISVQSLPF